jgi:hypothetical protein
MTKRISYFEYGRVYPPLVGDGAPVVPDEPDAAPEPERSPLRPWQVIALLWYIAFLAIIGGCIVTLLSYPPLPALLPPEWPECAIGLTIGFALCGVTLFVRRLARREENENNG